jgi:hypothetical protein
MKKGMLVLTCMAVLAVSLVAQGGWSSDINISNSITTSDCSTKEIYNKSVNNAQHQIAIPSNNDDFIHTVWCRNVDGNRTYYRKRTSTGWVSEIGLQEPPFILHNQFPSFSIASDNSGQKVYVAWHEEMLDANYRHICQIYITNSVDWGENWNTPYRVSPHDAYNPPYNMYYYEPDITVGGDGKIYVVWSNGFHGGSVGIGLAMGDFTQGQWEWNVIDQIDNTADLQDDFTPSISAEPNGYLIHIAWKQILTDGTSNGTCRIVYRNYNINSSSFGPLIEIARSQPNFNPRQYDSPHIECSKTDRQEVHIVWADDSEDPGSMRKKIYYRKSADGGNTWGDVVPLSQKPQEYYIDEKPVLSIGGSNDAYMDLLYHEYDPNPGGTDLLLWRRSLDHGNTWGDPITIPVDAGNNWPGHMATGVGGAAHFLFTSERDGNSEVYYKRNGITSPSVNITSPLEGEILSGYFVTTIRWDASDDYGISNFDIYLSRDDGMTWEPIALNLAPESRSYEWAVTNEDIDPCLLRIVATNVHSMSSRDFVNVSIYKTYLGGVSNLRSLSVIRGTPSNDKLIWTVGDNGMVKKITGYNTITDVEIGISGFDQQLWNFQGVSFADANNGWIVGYKRTGNDIYKGVILRMENGIWQQPTYSHRIIGLQETPDSLTPFLKVKVVRLGVSFRGFISCGNGYILRLELDGNWTPRRPQILNNGFYSPWYNSLWTDPTATYVWAGTDNGCLYAKSADGGVSWDFEAPGEFDKTYVWPPNTQFNAAPQTANLGVWCRDYNNAYYGHGHGEIGVYSPEGWLAQNVAPQPTWLYGLDSLRICGSEGSIYDYQGNEIVALSGSTFYDITSWKGPQPGNVNYATYSCAVGSNGRIVFEEPFFFFTGFTAVSIPGYQQVTLHWNTGGSSDEGLYLYEIFRSTSEISYGQKIAAITPNGSGNYTHVDNTVMWSIDFHYWIKAMMLDGRYKWFYSGKAMPTGLNQPSFGPPWPVASVVANDVPGDNGNKILLAWSSGTYNQYYIGRKKVDENAYTPLAATNSNSYIDNAVQNGVIYQYSVAVYMYNGVALSSELTLSNIVSSSDNINPDRVEQISGFYDSNGKNVSVYWQSISEPNLGGYWVCPEPLGKFASELPTSGVPDAYHVEHSSPIDRNLYKYRVPDNLIGQTLGFAVTAMDRSGNIGPWSPTVNINTNVTVQSTSPQATAYNNGRKLLYDKDGNLHLAYVSNDSVFYQKSWDDGYSWTPTAGLPSGGTEPLVALGVYGDDAILVWKASTPLEGWVLKTARRTGNAWTDVMVIDEREGWYEQTHSISSPTVTVDGRGIHLVVEKLESYCTPGGQSGHWNWAATYAFKGTEDESFTWTVVDDTSGSWNNNPPTDPKSPTICIDPKGGIHVAWDRDGEVWWRVWDPFLSDWKSKINLSHSPEEASLEPSLSCCGDVHLVWQEGSDIFHRKGNWGYNPDMVPPQAGGFWWADAENVSNSPATMSLWPVYAGGYAAWSEEMPTGDTEACCAHYSDFLWKQIPDFSKNPTQPSNYPHIAYRQNNDGNRMVTVWTEGTGPLYSLIARDTAGQVTPKLAAVLGGEEPSEYTIERDGYFTFEGGITVDYDSTELQYYLPSLDAGQETEIELVFYQPGVKADIQHKVYVNDIPLGVANITPGEVFTFSKKIPPTALKDGEGILRIENKKGVYASCARWQLFAYDRATGRGGKGGGQAELGGEKPVAYRYELLQNAPNPCRQTATIRYQLAKPGKVSLKIYNTLGQAVRTLADGERPAGHQSVNWDGRDMAGRNVAAGVYFYRLAAGEFEGTKRMVVLR